MSSFMKLFLDQQIQLIMNDMALKVTFKNIYWFIFVLQKRHLTHIAQYCLMWRYIINSDNL